MIALHAVMLRKSILDRVLQHDLIASVFDNKSALQYMCGDVMRHLADVGTSDPLGKVLVPILCSLLLSWASRFGLLAIRLCNLSTEHLYTRSYNVQWEKMASVYKKRRANQGT